jgi:hypothetical protein
MMHTPTSPSPFRRLLWRSVTVAAVAVALFADTGAQRIDTSSLPNFDIRTDRDAASAGYVSRAGSVSAAGRAFRSAARAEGLAALHAEVSAVETTTSAQLGTLEVVSAMPGAGFLTGPGTDRVSAMRAFLSRYSNAYGVSAAEMDGLTVVSNYVNPAGNMAWVELEQAINGIPVWQGMVRGGFTADGALARTTGTLASVFDASTLATTSSFTAAQAVARGAGSVGWTQDENALTETPGRAGSITVSRGTMAGDARAWLVYFPVTHGAARLAWAMELWGDPDAFLMVIDAEDGTLLFRKNATNYQTQSASYTVYNDDSPAPMSPVTMLPGSGTQAGYIGRTTIALIGNEGPLSFNNLGWMTDNTNGVNGWTDGNNVQAGLDVSSPDGIETIVGGVNRTFNSVYDPSVQAPNVLAYQLGEVVHQFYWSNMYHDKLYLLGFTEAAGNFQNDNFGRGGVQADRVSAEAQDYSGTNNANFTTLPDGTRGRMQMYIFTGPNPDRTSGLDNDVLLHELTHGTSNRLHGNASGLLPTMSGGMGEGWSDFYARALLSTAGENVNGIYSTGGWVTNLIVGGYVDNYYYGIRRFPYAVKTNLGINGKPHNPLTFADIDPAQVNLTDGAYPKGAMGSATAFQVHNIGEVWASALFEVRARFINRLGWATGNQRILQFVTDGMKLDPWNPTLLQGRNSIIAAANAGGGTAADIADIWAGFAARGMGVSARVVNPNSGTVVEAFDLPGTAAGGSSLTGESIPNGRVDPTETVSVSLCIANTSGATTGTVNGTLAASGGVTSPSGPQNFGTIGAGASVCRSYTFTVSASCGATVTATLGITESGGPSKNLTYAFQVGSPTVIYSQNFDGVGAPGLPAGWQSSLISGAANPWTTVATQSDTALNRAYATNLAVPSHSALLSPSIAMPAGAATLTFRHWYEMEPGWDGGVLEIAIPGVAGGAFQDIVAAGGSFVSGAYTYLSANGGAYSPQRNVWSGISEGYITTVVNMPAASQNQNIQLRWRLGSDNVFGTYGWSVDTIVVRLTAFNCGAAPAPGAFNKTSPANGATNQSTSPTLAWGASTNASSYEYCIDTSNNNACDTGWLSTGTNTSVGLSGLAAGTAHYWHVRANGTGTTYSNGGATAFWSFTTSSASPGAFAKTTPTNGATGVPMSPVLSWGAASGATSYEYCVDTSANGACNTSWVPVGTATSASVTLAPSTLHSWQVRAINGGGTTYAQGALASFWSFTTDVPKPAFGQVDTPAQNAAGVQGAIGVTGWALDDSGVNSVKIYRNCLAFEPANCQDVLGNSVVYIGDAAFLAGARPDVAAAFPTHPQNGRAGWGYLMLTPMLPHVPNSQPFGGQGPLTLYAIATDTGTNKTLLGRTFVPGPGFTTPTSITMANDSIAKPFGAIDTPGQGQTIAGAGYANFGWALTPDADTVAGAGDILIPTNGSTMAVFIDGLSVGLVAYNQCRGNVGNPVPAGVYCNDDVANIFGNVTPVLTPLAPRTSNPTRYRNLDAARAAIGAYNFNTLTMTNGLHTIAWSVTDSAGRVEGIGSRFFIVQNGIPLAEAAGSEDALRAAPARVLGTAESLAIHAPATDGVWGRTGYNLAAPWATMHTKEDGTFAVRLPELGRLELWLGTDVEAGYLVAEGKLHPLPVGSSLVGAQFGWTPPAGYTGAYELAFIRGGERLTVKVTVVERPKAVEGERQIRMELAADAHSAGQVKVAGTASDAQAAIGSGIDAVHVWAAAHDGSPVRGSVGTWVRGAATPVFLGAATLDREHFSLTAKLAPGTYTVTAYAWNQRTERWEDSRSVTVVVR